MLPKAKIAQLRNLTQNRDMETTYLKSAYEVVIGDVICESDGFMWAVRAVNFTAGRYSFEVEPVFSSMTARGPRTVTVKRSANVRVKGGR